jgi:uncharacterized coiled-coil protein SlyX
MPQTEHYFIEKPREKTNVVQATCISYEALHDVRAMLAERQNPESGFLFICGTFKKGEQLTTRSVNEAMKDLALKTFGAEKAKQFKTKTLRSFYNSALLRSGIKQEIKDVMMGHKRLGARGHYAYDEYTIKDAYSEAFQHLTINGLQSREDLAELRNAFNTTKAQLAELITEQKKQIEQQNDKMSTLAEMLMMFASENPNLSEEKKAKFKETLKKRYLS